MLGNSTQVIVLNNACYKHLHLTGSICEREKNKIKWIIWFIKIEPTHIFTFGSSELNVKEKKRIILK